MVFVTIALGSMCLFLLFVLWRFKCVTSPSGEPSIDVGIDRKNDSVILHLGILTKGIILQHEDAVLLTNYLREAIAALEEKT